MSSEASKRNKFKNQDKKPSRSGRLLFILDFLGKIYNNTKSVRVFADRTAPIRLMGKRDGVQCLGFAEHLLERQRRNAMAQASLKQVNRLLELIVESGWSREELQRRIIERWGLIRQITEAVDELGEDQVRSMHPLFYYPVNFPSLRIAADLIPNGWRLVSDVEPVLKSVERLEFLPFLHGDEVEIDIEVLRWRAKKLGANLGLGDAKFILALQKEIPVDLHDKYIVFPGTVLRSQDGGSYVPCLDRSPNKWVLRFVRLHDSLGLLGYDWNGRGRLVRNK